MLLRALFWLSLEICVDGDLITVLCPSGNFYCPHHMYLPKIELDYFSLLQLVSMAACPVMVYLQKVWLYLLYGL